MRHYWAFLLISLTGYSVSSAQRPFDKEAHRGGRGLMPENTIAAMLDAIERDVTTLEMDLQLSKDHKVVVSHDPAFNSGFTTSPDGDTLTKEAAQKIILYQLYYDSIAKYDVGIKCNPEFPRQKKVQAIKPLLSDLLDKTEAYAKQRKRQIYYNIEIKSSVAGDGKFYPDVATFIDLALNVINKKGIAGRVLIQSFDVRALRLLHRKYPQYALSFLIDTKEKRSVNVLLDDLGFDPAVLSPHSKMVTIEMISDCHRRNVKVIPWTVNDLQEMKKLKEMGVDGVITDYPDLFSQL